MRWILTEYARLVPLTLERAYEETCSQLPLTSGPCADAGAEAGADAAPSGESDAGPDASTSVPPPATIPCVEQRGGCTDFDDIEVAARGLDPSNVWITRMRADLPLDSLKTDLRLEAAEQTEVRSDHIVKPSTRCEDTKGCQAERRAPIGTWTLAGLTALIATSIARRRRRR